MPRGLGLRAESRRLADACEGAMVRHRISWLQLRGSSETNAALPCRTDGGREVCVCGTSSGGRKREPRCAVKSTGKHHLPDARLRQFTAGVLLLV